MRGISNNCSLLVVLRNVLELLSQLVIFMHVIGRMQKIYNILQIYKIYNIFGKTYINKIRNNLP